MKVGVIGHKHIPSREGGIEKTVGRQVEMLSGRGYEFVLYNRSGHPLVEEKTSREETLPESVRVRTVPAPPRPWGVPLYAFLATVSALWEHCDVIYYHGSGSCMMIPLARLFGGRCVAMLHGIDSERAKWGRFGRWVLRLGERAAGKRAHACLVLSQHMKTFMRERYGCEAIITNNGTERPAVDPAQTGEILASLGLKEGGYVLFMARLVPEKGLHYLIPAFRACRTDKKLVIAGGDDPACTAYRRRLSEEAAGDPRIVFLGYREEPAVSALYAGASLFVLPSDVEGMANSLLEAMAAGCRCLVSDIPENADVIGERGWTFRHGDTEDLTERLQELLDAPEEGEAQRKERVDWVMSSYRWETCVSRLEEVFREVCSCRK